MTAVSALFRRFFLPVLVGFLIIGLHPADAQGQSGDRWWRPIVEDADEYAPEWSENRTDRSNRRGPRRNLHIPPGHRPPPGSCRLWIPRRPPGQQPPPMDCRRAVRQSRGEAVVVTHRGSVYRPAPRRRAAPRWHRRPADGIVFRRQPERDRRVTISVEILIHVLGERGYDRLLDQRRRAGLEGELAGRWVDSRRSGARVLQVRAGRSPLAELADRDRDGRVDVMFVREGSPRRR